MHIQLHTYLNIWYSASKYCLIQDFDLHNIDIHMWQGRSYLVVNMVTFVHTHSEPPTCSQIELNRHKPKQTHLAGCSRVDAADGSTGGERRPLQPLKQQHVSCLVCQQVCQSRKDEWGNQSDHTAHTKLQVPCRFAPCPARCPPGRRGCRAQFGWSWCTTPRGLSPRGGRGKGL